MRVHQCLLVIPMLSTAASCSLAQHLPSDSSKINPPTLQPDSVLTDSAAPPKNPRTIVFKELRNYLNGTRDDRFDTWPRPLIPFERLLEYPEVARRSGMQGSVTLCLLVDSDGTVGDVRVLKASHDIFRKAAIDAAHRESFQPAMRTGRPVPVWVTETIHFRLNR